MLDDLGNTDSSLPHMNGPDPRNDIDMTWNLEALPRNPVYSFTSLCVLPKNSPTKKRRGVQPFDRPVILLFLLLDFSNMREIHLCLCVVIPLS